MSKNHLIQYQDKRYGLLFPCPAAHLETLDFLLGCLVGAWEHTQFDTNLLMQDPYWDIACAIADFIPSHPRMPLDMNRVKTDPFLFQALFLREKPGDRSILQKLHAFEPLNRREELQPGEEITLKHLPFPSCGDSNADHLAGVLYSMGLSDGLKMWDRFDAETLDKISAVLAELNRPEDERIREFLALKKAEWEQRVHGDDPEGGLMDQLEAMQRSVRGEDGNIANGFIGLDGLGNFDGVGGFEA